MFRLILALLLLALLPGVSIALISALKSFLQAPSELLFPLCIGFVIGLLLDEYLLRRIPGLETFEHELTHAFAAILFLRRITNFTVTLRRGGAVEHSGSFGGRIGDDFIGLAPYLLPTFSALTILLRPLIPEGWFPWYDGAIGFTFGFHTWSTIRETRRNWSSELFPIASSGEMVSTDIARRGHIYSIIYILTTTVAVHGLLIAVLTGGFGGLTAWASEVWTVTASVISTSSEWLLRHVSTTP